MADMRQYGTVIRPTGDGQTPDAGSVRTLKMGPSDATRLAISIFGALSTMSLTLFTISNAYEEWLQVGGAIAWAIAIMFVLNYSLKMLDKKREEVRQDATTQNIMDRLDRIENGVNETRRQNMDILRHMESEKNAVGGYRQPSNRAAI